MARVFIIGKRELCFLGRVRAESNVRPLSVSRERERPRFLNIIKNERGVFFETEK